MKEFMGQDFLLTTECSKRLYHEYVKCTPIIDYHCHINPKEIAENRKFENITQVWLGGDHYKWRLMRSNGIEEKYITGDASDWEKFQKWAETLEKALGNPLYHWSHLELQRYFGYSGSLSSKTAQEVWSICNDKLRNMCARDFITMSNVEVICTTDDPVDDLIWHKEMERDDSFAVKVLPTWRPDKAIGVEKQNYIEYIKELEQCSNITIDSFESWKIAINNRLDYFEAHGCKISDHGLGYVMYNPIEEEKVDIILKKRLLGESITKLEELQFKTTCLLFLARQYHKRGWVMQLHYGVKRDNNKRMFEKLGPDTGYDCIGSIVPMDELVDFLNALEVNDELPKTILYSLNPNDNATIGTILGCFQNGEQVGKIQHGSAWWFNDNKKGMQEQIISLANLGMLSSSVGMLTDSRSFLSYTRHEYYRRILCDLIGCWVENGEYPEDEETLKKIVQDISYFNSVKYFGF